jgi:signal peptidase I
VSSFVRGLLIVVGVLAVVGGVLRATVFEPWTVPDDPILALSIAPTLSGGDVVLLWTVGERGFGELVRCPDPEDPQRWVVGRIVGLPGDTVEVSPQGIVTVNGTRYNVSDACTDSRIELQDDKGNQYELTCSRVEMAGGWHYRGMVAGESADRPITHEVGPDLVYLLSDDRTLHDDSRDFGAVDKASCKDLIAFRLWGKDGFFSSKTRFDYVH